MPEGGEVVRLQLDIVCVASLLLFDFCEICPGDSEIFIDQGIKPLASSIAEFQSF